LVQTAKSVGIPDPVIEQINTSFLDIIIDYFFLRLEGIDEPDWREFVVLAISTSPVVSNTFF
jgi:hypothetical protein